MCMTLGAPKKPDYGSCQESHQLLSPWSWINTTVNCTNATSTFTNIVADTNLMVVIQL